MRIFQPSVVRWWQTPPTSIAVKHWSIVCEWKRQSENGYVDQQNIGRDPSNKHSPSSETPQKGVWWHRESKDRSHHWESEAITRLNRVGATGVNDNCVVAERQWWSRAREEDEGGDVAAEWESFQTLAEDKPEVNRDRAQYNLIN
jgi:hypothetical protein